MDFAKSILEKYGWKEGEGIGKNSDGIAQPVKANLKFDSAGLGHDKAKEFTNHWWQNAFNTAAQNIDVSQTEGNVSMSLKTGESIEITTKDYSLKDLRNNKKEKTANGYGSFVKSASVLKKDGCNDHKIESHPNGDDVIKAGPSNASFSNVMSDEALFAACGGRTAHKGARHGLSLGGKLTRIEEQERQLLEKYAKTFSSDNATKIFKDWVKVDSKKKKKQKGEMPPTPVVEGVNDPMDPLKLNGLVSNEDYAPRGHKTKKKKRQHRNLDEELATTLSSLNTTSNCPTISNDLPIDNKLRGVQSNSTTIKKKKKKRSRVNHTDGAYAAFDEVIPLPELNEHGEIDDEQAAKSKYLKKSKSKYKVGCDEKSMQPHTSKTVSEVKIKGLTSKTEEKSKKRKREIEVAPDYSDDDDIELNHGKLAQQIENEIQKRPNKKIKVVIENITAFQSKHLAKAGIEFVERKNDDPAKMKKESREFERIARKLRNSMSLEDTE